MWGVSGSMSLANRSIFTKEFNSFCSVDLPTYNSSDESLIDYEVDINSGKWSQWTNKVPHIEIDPNKVTDADVIITTVDTLRH